MLKTKVQYNNQIETWSVLCTLLLLDEFQLIIY